MELVVTMKPDSKNAGNVNPGRWNLWELDT